MKYTIILALLLSSSAFAAKTDSPRDPASAITGQQGEKDACTCPTGSCAVPPECNDANRSAAGLQATIPLPKGGSTGTAGAKAE